ncbi:hypothetical protein AYL99_11830 [Fonsecaea erecta]|uniref:Uncharacterized protein n=1 Tax=Fonsecaea erecta TaxID=1367422 RepID=A0A178Z2F8_9EURO|nr:hypothetical protein AYL99_11830 [Fonsecaea erecta]OAP53950.1 hypothetical protein AYL99_11830 [Fonsecaea erecta]
MAQTKSSFPLLVPSSPVAGLPRRVQLCGNGGASVRRFMRCITKTTVDSEVDSWPTIKSTIKPASIFGTSNPTQKSPYTSPASGSVPRSHPSRQDDIVGSRSREVWHIPDFSFAEHRNVHISASASDESESATLNVNDDPLLGMSWGFNAFFPLASPLGHAGSLSPSSKIPGHGARLFAIGTMSGIVMLWDMRASLSPSPEVPSTVSPRRVTYTESPQIASLASSTKSTPSPPEGRVAAISRDQKEQAGVILWIEMLPTPSSFDRPPRILADAHDTSRNAAGPGSPRPGAASSLCSETGSA